MLTPDGDELPDSGWKLIMLTPDGDELPDSGW
jgi:hypothetical protein